MFKRVSRTEACGSGQFREDLWRKRQCFVDHILDTPQAPLRHCVLSCALLELLNDAVFPTLALAGHVSSAYHRALHAH